MSIVYVDVLNKSDSMGGAHPEIYCPVLKVTLRNSAFAQIHISKSEENTERTKYVSHLRSLALFSEADGCGGEAIHIRHCECFDQSTMSPQRIKASCEVEDRTLWPSTELH